MAANRGIAVSGAIALLVAAAGSAQAATETIVDCGAFKSRWGAAVRSAEADHPELAFQPLGPRLEGVERVSNVRGATAQLRCSEGKLVRVEIKASTGAVPMSLPQPFARYAAAALLALDPELAPEQAATIVDTLRADATGTRDGVSSFGPYEVSLRAGGRSGPGEFIIDLPEN